MKKNMFLFSFMLCNALSATQESEATPTTANQASQSIPLTVKQWYEDAPYIYDIYLNGNNFTGLTIGSPTGYINHWNTVINHFNERGHVGIYADKNGHFNEIYYSERSLSFVGLNTVKLGSQSSNGLLYIWTTSEPPAQPILAQAPQLPADILYIVYRINHGFQPLSAPQKPPVSEKINHRSPIINNLPRTAPQSNTDTATATTKIQSVPLTVKQWYANDPYVYDIYLNGNNFTGLTIGNTTGYIDHWGDILNEFMQDGNIILQADNDGEFYFIHATDETDTNPSYRRINKWTKKEGYGSNGLLYIWINSESPANPILAQAPNLPTDEVAIYRINEGSQPTVAPEYPLDEDEDENANEKLEAEIKDDNKKLDHEIKELSSIEKQLK